MNIVFITTSFFPATGGVERHCLQLGTELLRRDHQLTVFAPLVANTTPTETVSGITIQRFKFRPFVTAWFDFWKWREVLKKADVIHLHDFFSYLWVAPYLIFGRKKFFVTFHGWEGRVPPHPVVIKLRRFIEQRSQGSIVIGRFLERWYQQHPTMVLYGGVDSEATPVSRGLDPTHLKFVWLGRLATDTDALKALEFFKLVQARFPTSHLDILGDGPLKPAAEEFVTKHNLPVTFHGFVADPRPHLAAADLTLVSGYLGILETLAAGSLVGSLYSNDLKRDYLLMSPFAPLITTAASAAELTDKVTELISHPDQVTKLKVDALPFVQQHTWKNLADAYERLWTKTL